MRYILLAICAFALFYAVDIDVDSLAFYTGISFFLFGLGAFVERVIFYFRG